jgi:ElaB/YqjD/DUF883 family membrane-anchored ribosome-binding protein
VASAGWKDKLKKAASAAAEQGKKAAEKGKEQAEKAKASMAEQQAKRNEQWANDPDTLWFGTSKDAAAKATGFSKATYRITKSAVWIDSGLLGTRSEQVPLYSVKDIDVRQSVLQRGKDIGDVILILEDAAYNVADAERFNLTGELSSSMSHGHGAHGQVTLDNIEEPYKVREILMPIISEARSKKLIERQSQYVHVNPGATVAAGMGGNGGGGSVDVAEQLKKLSSLRDEGILSEEEFAAQKAKLLG